MDNKKAAKLTTGELAHCWEQLMNNSMSNVILEYLTITSELEEVKSLCNEAGSISKSAVQFFESVLRSENYPIPKGFNIKDDLNPNAPKMYTDVFILFYLNNMSKIGMSLTSMALTDSVRGDIRNFFHKQLKNISSLFERTTTILLEMGVFVRPPSITSTHETNPIADKGFLGNFFNDKRELTAREANELHKNVFMNYIGKNLLIGFIQSTSNQQLMSLLQHGKELSLNIIDKLGDILVQNDLPISMTWDTNVLDGKTSPFSDKLISYLLDQLNRDGIASYGYSAAVSIRKDLSLLKTKKTKKLPKYGSFFVFQRSILYLL